MAGLVSMASNSAYNMAMKVGLQALESNLLPDFVLRKASRFLLSMRLSVCNKPSVEEQLSQLMSFVESLKTMPIAINTSDANAQHYEVPTEFYRVALGKHLKYSSAYFPSKTSTLDEAEAAMLEIYCQRSGSSSVVQTMRIRSFVHKYKTRVGDPLPQFLGKVTGTGCYTPSSGLKENNLCLQSSSPPSESYLTNRKDPLQATLLSVCAVQEVRVSVGDGQLIVHARVILDLPPQSLYSKSSNWHQLHETELRLRTRIRECLKIAAPGQQVADHYRICLSLHTQQIMTVFLKTV